VGAALDETIRPELKLGYRFEVYLKEKSAKETLENQVPGQA